MFMIHCILLLGHKVPIKSPNLLSCQILFKMDWYAKYMVSPLTKYHGLFSQISNIGPYFGLFVQAFFSSLQLHLIQLV